MKLTATIAALVLSSFLTTATRAEETQVPNAPGAATTALPPVVMRWAAAWNSADAGAMAALFTEDGAYRDEAFEATFTKREGIATWVKITTSAIPDAQVQVIDAFQAGDLVAVRWVFKGTPLNFGPIKATGKSFSVPAVSIFDMRGEQITKVTDTYNLADLFRQVGADTSDWAPPNP
jgi:steroid delta-isomerase-like uncharacterized protein